VRSLRLELKSVEGLRVAIVGSGFAGSILARALHLQGQRVTLLDRQRHPRFALGESGTPLAALSLERLARLPGLDDLRHLAAYGRWRRHLPELRRGLKRGFTFYRHQPGERFANSAANDHRLLVAASPSDAIADAHWLRADVDAYLARQAEAAGVACLEGAEVTAVERRPSGWHLAGSWQGEPFGLDADLLLDASGAGGFLTRHLAIPPAATGGAPRTSLVYGHFAGVRPFSEVATSAELPAGPYPDERAAVHHLLAEGWMYVLPFDHGTVSAGFVLADPAARERAARLAPESAWEEILGRYPTLAEQFGDARPERPVEFIPRLQHRAGSAAGPDWALLPHAFCFWSPMFSTGIAWSLLAVERLVRTIERAEDGEALARGLERYGQLLQREADHLERLVAGAYLAAARDFDLFVAWTDLYFAAASFAEVRQRLCPEGGGAWAWEGFLGSTDPRLRAAVERTLRQLRALSRDPLDRELARRFAATVRRRIAPYNVAGLADPARNRLYPVVLEPLVAHPHRVGLTAAELGERLHRLRGDPD
jgi:tetracycline 7-halogenase / FADH2 O2-dependent halogenase